MKHTEYQAQLFPEDEAWEMWRLSVQNVPRLMPLAREQLQRYRDLYQMQNFKDTLELVKRQSHQAHNFFKAGALAVASGLTFEAIGYDPVENANPIAVAVGGSFLFTGYIMKRSIRFNGTIPASPQVMTIDNYLAELNSRILNHQDSQVEAGE